MAVRGKLAAHFAALPAVAHEAHAKSQSGYQPDAISPKTRCTPPLIDIFQLAMAVVRLLQMFVFPRYLQAADGLNQD